MDLLRLLEVLFGVREEGLVVAGGLEIVLHLRIQQKGLVRSRELAVILTPFVHCAVVVVVGLLAFPIMQCALHYDWVLVLLVAGRITLGVG